MPGDYVQAEGGKDREGFLTFRGNQGTAMSWLPKNRVIVPVDFSENSLSAVDTALQLVAKPEDVTVVHVLQDMSPLEPGETWNTIDAQTRIRHAMTALRERLQGDAYARVTFDVLLGDPGHEIADLAEREKAELIVLPSHGRRGLRRLLIGSVAERVVRLAHCPVLVLRS
jgi:nucleotide-binding universal stress UspA family protein